MDQKMTDAPRILVILLRGIIGSILSNFLRTYKQVESIVGGLMAGKSTLWAIPMGNLAVPCVMTHDCAIETELHGVTQCFSKILRKSAACGP